MQITKIAFKAVLAGSNRTRPRNLYRPPELFAQGPHWRPRAHNIESNDTIRRASSDGRAVQRPRSQIVLFKCPAL